MPKRDQLGGVIHTYQRFDPKNLPKQIMLQWNDGTWEHRAYWGDNVIPFGNGNNPGHRRIGKLPKAGEWVRLEVEAAHVGLNPGAKVNGWAYQIAAGYGEKLSKKLSEVTEDEKKSGS